MTDEQAYQEVVQIFDLASDYWVPPIAESELLKVAGFLPLTVYKQALRVSKKSNDPCRVPFQRFIRRYILLRQRS